MKTTKILSVISIMMLFTVLSSSFGAGAGTKGVIPVNPVIRHEVNISVILEKPLCNTYFVRILNGEGRDVMPAKLFVPGTTKYIFYEAGPATGIRAAVLAPAVSGERLRCELEMLTEPVILYGPFEAGQTYRYDLFPVLTGAGE